MRCRVRGRAAEVWPAGAPKPADHQEVCAEAGSAFQGEESWLMRAAPGRAQACRR